MKRTNVKELLKSTEYDKEVTIQGWVRTKRDSKQVVFLAINDGSIIHNIQAVAAIDAFPEELLKSITTGSCVAVKGTLVKSQGQGQAVEIQAKEINIYGGADETFPLQKKGHTLEFLREIAHLRPRTNTIGAVMRVRHAMSYAIHKYFNDNGFYYLHTPVITGSDAEGAGEMFRVTTLDLKNPPKNPDGTIDYKEDFFGKETNLTVSGQLEAETAAMALSKVYTFGPTFRAENSNTPRHLAEFWMIEPEVAFNDVHDNMDLAEDMLKYLIKYALDNCIDDLTFLNNMYDKELLNRLNMVKDSTFKRVTYTEGIEILKSATKKFEFKPEWGADLQKEHENHLVEHFNCPVMVTDYPKGIKAFYMKLNEDGKTVRGMDVLFPYVGEIMGGSQREENYDKLLARIREMGLPEKEMWWYLELRKFGTAPHSGFGLGLERLILFVTGMSNIRDVIPFPRTPKNAEF